MRAILPRGTFRIEVKTTPGTGTYTLRWWGLAPPRDAERPD
jgi:hypothetical protein